MGARLWRLLMRLRYSPCELHAARRVPDLTSRRGRSTSQGRVWPCRYHYNGTKPKAQTCLQRGERDRQVCTDPWRKPNLARNIAGLARARHIDHLEMVVSSLDGWYWTSRHTAARRLLRGARLPVPGCS